MNGFVKIFLITPLLYVGYDVLFETEFFLERTFGFYSNPIPYWVSIVGYTITISITNDFTSFIIHWWMHRSKVLWEFHKIHHSATVLNPISQYRLHPIELLINNLRSILIFGLVTGIFEYISAGAVSKVTYLGVNVISLFFLSWGANLRHSHVRLGYFNFLEKVFISPLQHQIHHSNDPAHFNKNMGAKLAIWDYLFGTLLVSNKINKIRFGLDKNENLKYRSLLGALFTPFRNLFSGQ